METRLSAAPTPASPPLRIAIVASWYPAAYETVGGIFVRDQAEALASRFDVGVIAPHVLSPRSIARGELRPGSTAALDLGIPTVRPTAARVRFARTLSARSYEAAVERGLRALWPSARPDLLHAHVVLPGGLAAVRVGRRLGIPVVLTEHSGPFSAHLTSEAARVHVVEALQGAGRVIAVGDRLAEEIRAVADVQVDVIPNVVAPVFFSNEPFVLRSSGHLRLLAVGYLVPQKRFDLLLAALAGATTQPHAELVIVGDGPDRAALTAQAARLGVADRVRFVQVTDRPGLLGWLEWCDALVSTSDHESFGLVIAEALAAGRPVLTTGSGGPEAFVTEGLGRIVPRGDISALASAIECTPGWLGGFDPSLARARMAALFGPDTFRAQAEAIYAGLVANYLGRVEVTR